MMNKIMSQIKFIVILSVLAPKFEISATINKPVYKTKEECQRECASNKGCRYIPRFAGGGDDWDCEDVTMTKTECDALCPQDKAQCYEESHKGRTAFQCRKK